MFTRYAIYFTPQGPLAAFGASWLGWDSATGAPVAHPTVAGINVAEVTQTPRKYGLHGTIKPPFHLTEGTTPEALADATARLCATLAPVTLTGLHLSRLGSFLALTPVGDQTTLASLAAQMVTQLDNFRAPATAVGLERRRERPLTPAQEQNLQNWGYPYVMGDFRFHITLTGSLPPQTLETVRGALAPLVAPLLPHPFVVDSLTLVGQRDDGRFQDIHRYALTG